MALNSKKTKALVVRCPQINIFINGINSSKRINSNAWALKYQAMDATPTEIASRIRQAKMGFLRIKSIPVLTNKYISIHTRRATECYIVPILMYGCEARTISKQQRISWTEKKSNKIAMRS